VNKTVFLVVLGVVVALAAVGIFVKRANGPRVGETVVSPEMAVRPLEEIPQAPQMGAPQQPQPTGSVTFGTPKKSAHFESSTPAHGSTLPAPPINVVVDFNFDLVSKSSISIMKDGKEYGTGATTMSANKLSLRRAMGQSAPDGVYVVAYTACWPDGTCHDGRFEFAIDRTHGAAALDLRGQTAVLVSLKDIAFNPMTIRIRKGTKVTWRNDDDVEHYVNTDAHPSHTYFPPQNSRVLKKGDTFTTTFTAPGAYPYHCSAHAATMAAMIIVE
jgi:plastocyanin/methionine-rich copper-binding protein CopC